MKLTALAPAKVNLCLFLGPRRSDGRHELVTLLESVSLCDELELITGSAEEDEVLCPGVDGPNIVSRALAGLRARGWKAPPVQVRIHKRIPVAAGLGGGSADAAAALRMAQRLSPIPSDAVADLAAELGADVPSQLAPGPAVGTGAGDEVAPVPPLAPHALLILPQAHQLSTADVYREADRLGLPRGDGALGGLWDELTSALRSGPQLPDPLLVNDLAPAAIALCPAIERALAAAREAGADHALVCGSGPTVAGLYWGPDGEPHAAAAGATLRERFPGVSVVLPVERGVVDP